jgi:formyl-CoA transferase
MTAIVAREINGFGQHVDVSIMEVVAHTEWHATAAYAHDGTSRSRRGSLIDQKVLRTNDGYFGAFINWPRVKEVIGPALDDPRFATPAGRSEHTREFGDAIESWLMQRGKLEAYHEGQAKGMAWGYIATMEDLVTSDQYRAREVFRELEHPVAGKALYSRPCFRVGDLPDGPWQPAPRLGEHNTQVYGALLGLDRGDLTRLKEAGVI